MKSATVKRCEAGATSPMAPPTAKSAVISGRGAASSEPKSRTVTRRLIAEFARSRAGGTRPDPRLDVLTDREHQMRLVAAGCTNNEIASSLVLSPLTAKPHVSRIMSGPGARDRSQVVVMAYEYGLVDPGRLDL
ncbi:LuxR C-terminal-related transcriptional regulator [Streptomyces cyaneofuscatus]|uniref:LuxR C-terminal-related transcriptional regulator n=1 Tax=Streptomyces cyaneofuscatus TaxID=66883 RepID=UPI003661E9F8